MNNELEIGKIAAIRAGEVIRKFYKADYQIKDKGYKNPVTTADFEANKVIKEILMNSFPSYGWLSEETEDSTSRLSKEKVWVVDPLDGTKEFIEGIPHFVVSIALVKNGEPIIGVLHNPVTKDIFHAIKGSGSFLNDSVYKCNAKDSTLDMVILNSRSETRKGLWEPYKLQFKELKPIGSVAYKMGLTAVGDADIFATLRPKNEWDICAGTCLINESGGKVIDLNGEALTFNNKKTLIEPGLIAGYQSSVDKTYKIFNER